MRASLNVILVLLIGFLPFSASSQTDSTSVDYGNSMFGIPGHGHMADLRLSLGIYPEVQFINSPVIGVSASFARLLDVEWSSFSRGVNVGFEFDPTQDFYGPKVSVWGDFFALFFGLNAGVSLMYYRQVNRGGLYFRPEIGIGIPRLHVKYGFGFRLAGEEIMGVQRHSLTLGYHFSLWRKDK